MTLKRELDEKLKREKNLELKLKEKLREYELLKEIAKLRGEPFKGEPKMEELDILKNEIKEDQKRIEKLKREILEGLKDVTFNIPLEIPKVNSERKSIIKFEGKPCDYVIKYISQLIGDSDIPIRLNNIELYPDKLIVKNVKNEKEVIESLKSLKNNIKLLAQTKLGESNSNIEETADYLYNCSYRDIWEAIKGRKRVSYNDLITELDLKTDKEKKRIRNFFTNLERQLKDKFPFMRVSPGVYELTFFGSLVWTRYCDKYLPKLKDEIEVSHEKDLIELSPKKEKKIEKITLNKFTNNDIEIIYGILEEGIENDNRKTEKNYN